MSNIPLARKLLQQALDDDGVDRSLIQAALDLMTREPAARKAAPRSRRLTPALKMSIRLFARENPGMSLQEIGAMFGVNDGRVSQSIDRKNAPK